MATKRAAPGPKSQDQRNPSPKQPIPSAAQKQEAEKIVSIPNDLVLAPQVEAPRQPTGRDQSRQKPNGVVELSWAEFDRSVQKLARTIRQSFEPQAVVGVAHGGVYVGGALAGALGCQFFPVRISRRSRDKVERTKNRAQQQVSEEMPPAIKGLRVLIVDDIASSGDTLELATALARKMGAKEIKTACLVARPEGFTPDHAGMSTDALFVFPWDYEPVMAEAHFDDDPDKAGA
ncbi:phosphoribosyltransferase [Corallococcus sicarius]|uniref:Phosphoribosyl transferase n=1 Tax=Corallococcus sicarius TaxID=2316726 RepID=A0A3A8NH57_9BACT|nr:phosphoribosyltransferase family protein [Corallococcus sicarius]RKH43716.1 phosphoribosyl transferase [Corallococcus sicarius]